ncbi:hypothetical protein [Burkholderia humptydooensis]|uniref:hypothetical protein n=1 Tax=Burkholderia humptydooensis TaxID=430531 RepID=UPI0010FD8140|nr:hypothetical protein [Burkholderia humptydooensis]
MLPHAVLESGRWTLHSKDVCRLGSDIELSESWCAVARLSGGTLQVFRIAAGAQGLHRARVPPGTGMSGLVLEGVAAEPLALRPDLMRAELGALLRGMTLMMSAALIGGMTDRLAMLVRSSMPRYGAPREMRDAAVCVQQALARMDAILLTREMSICEASARVRRGELMSSNVVQSLYRTAINGALDASRVAARIFSCAHSQYVRAEIERQTSDIAALMQCVSSGAASRDEAAACAD